MLFIQYIVNASFFDGYFKTIGCKNTKNLSEDQKANDFDERSIESDTFKNNIYLINISSL